MRGAILRSDSDGRVGVDVERCPWHHSTSANIGSAEKKQANEKDGTHAQTSLGPSGMAKRRA